MNDADLRAAAALQDLLWLRVPFEEAAAAIVPHAAGDYQGAPLAVLDRTAMRAALDAYRNGTLTDWELRSWAFLLHQEIEDVLDRGPYLGYEPRAKMLLHEGLHRLMNPGPDGITAQTLEGIERDLDGTDRRWLARRPEHAPAAELTAVAVGALVLAPVTAPWRPEAVSVWGMGTILILGGLAFSITVVRVLVGAEAAALRLQFYAPMALSSVAVFGAATVIGHLI